jgi:outer membrane beta-barrel protein
MRIACSLHGGRRGLAHGASRTLALLAVAFVLACTTGCAVLRPAMGDGPAPVIESPLPQEPTSPPQADLPRPANEQVIDPQVQRRPVKLPRFPSSDIEAGVFTGTYAAQNFGSYLLTGVRLGYHITEDFFAEAAYGRTKIDDSTFRQVLPGGVFPTGEETLRYTNLSIGVNVLPGEIFIGRDTAKASAAYVMAGLGSTRFNNQRFLTFSAGLGLRVLLSDWAVVQADMRDHIFELDLLGDRRISQNFELSFGVTFNF